MYNIQVIKKEGAQYYTVWINHIEVGRGHRAECQNLADELKADTSGEKVRAVLGAFNTTGGGGGKDEPRTTRRTI